MKFRDPRAFTIKNCTFRNCTSVADGQLVEWFEVKWACTCGHRSEAEHLAAPVLRSFETLAAPRWYQRLWWRLFR